MLKSQKVVPLQPESKIFFIFYILGIKNAVKISTKQSYVTIRQTYTMFPNLKNLNKIQ